MNETPTDSDTSAYRILGALAMLTVAGAGLHFIAPVFAPMFLALTLVLAVRPVGQWMIRKGLPSTVSASLEILLLVILVFGMMGVTVLLLTPVPQTLMNYAGNFEAITNSTVSWLSDHGFGTVDISTFVDRSNFNQAISLAWELVDRLSSIGGLIAILVVAAFFITVDTTTTRRRAALIAEKHGNLGRALSDFERRVRSYWIVSTVFGLIVAVIDGGVLQFMSIPLAWTWAYWAFITNYIPNIGFVLGVMPPMAMALLDQGWQAMVWVLVWYTAINVVIQTFIQPKFTGDAVGLSPTVTFISLALWTLIVGILGSILAVPLTLLFKSILVDADPHTRWLDAFFVSESDLGKRTKKGQYDPVRTARKRTNIIKAVRGSRGKK